MYFAFQPPVQIVNYTQSQRDLDKFGAYTLAEWKPDSSMIAVMTSKHHVIFFKVDLDISVPNHHCLYVQQEGKLYNTKKDLNGIPDSDSVPAIKIGPCSQLDLEADITCCLCVREDLVIATSDGHLNRIKWNGTKSEKNSLFIRDFPVSMDFQNTKGKGAVNDKTNVTNNAAKLTESDGYVVHMEYSPIIGGYVMVLSSGRAMFVIPPSTKADNGVAQGVWVKDLKDTVCLAVNHRYRLMAFGCKKVIYRQMIFDCEGGAGVVYVINEVEGTLEVSYKLSVSSKDYPDAAQTAGSVHCMKWTPDGTALALCWQNGGYSLWSVFGSLLFSYDSVHLFPPPVKAMVSLKSPPPVKAMVSLFPPPVKAMVSLFPPPVKAMVSLFPPPVKAMVSLFPPPVKAMVSLFPHQSKLCQSYGKFISPPVKAMVSLFPPPVKAMVSLFPPTVKAMVGLFPPPVKAMEWGLEGYQLWMVCGDQKEAHQTDYNDNTQCSHAMQLHFVKSALTVNPCSANHEHVFLQGEDKIYLNMGDSSQKPSHLESHVSVGNKLWQMIPISHSYLASNWPIRYAAVDKTGQCVAVAGKTGLAHYTCSNRKWKLFGNETQERDLVVSGGMSWWKDFICVACYNIVGQRDEIRCYPRGCKLDNTFSMSVKVPSQILLLNIFRDILIVFCIDSHIMLFNLERKNTQSNPALDINKRQEVSLNNYVPHPVCVTGLALSSLKTEYGAKNQHIAKEAESLLLNVAGKLLMFPRDNTGPQIKENNLPKNKPLPFCPPAMVATNVENMWTSSRVNVEKAQLMEALWLSCGAQGMKVWLPLYPRDESKHNFMSKRIMLPFRVDIHPLGKSYCYNFMSKRIMLTFRVDIHPLENYASIYSTYRPLGKSYCYNFMSKRIMLPFRVDIHPLAVLFEDAVILGAATDAVTYNYKSPGEPGHAMHNLPFSTIERTSQIYLHHILRQLLRRNLGVNALDIARCCTELPYFPHVVLELLLHEVLEAEATSKEPIPDPLLPRVVAFIQEFPEYLQTVVHCARKTEVALWPYLFSTVGNPKDLFEVCLVDNQLETAASYLIILQNLERPIISKQLARDIIRFLKAIDPAEVESYQLSSSLSRVNSGSSYPSSYSSPPITPPDTDGFSFSSVSNVSNLNRVRSSSVTGSEVQNVPKGKEKLKHTKSDNPLFRSIRQSSKNKEEQPSDQMFIDALLCRHARKLLEENRLRDLGFFAGNVEGFHFVTWLKQERLKGGKVEDFVTALRDLHHQFQWPLPVLSYAQFQQMKFKNFSTSSLGSLSLLDDDIVDSTKTMENEQTSHPGRLKSQMSDPNMSQSLTDDIFLKPQVSRTEESSLATMEISDNSSLLGEFDYMIENSSQSESLSPELELLSQEIANKGPHQSELELRYLLQIMLEAGCLEWGLLVSIVIRDALAVVRTVNTASMTDTPLEIVGRMREGLSYLELWSDTECVGYKPFFHAIRGQIQVLTKLVEQTPPTLHLEPIDPSPISEEQLSPVPQEIRTLDKDSPEKDLEKTKEDKPSECAVS
ncbi:RIC1 [Mytilus edulis]|uniref:Protein RIC1 homolog n=1 Tax=Mytilus edulis TaxID=6550 RepID=A0A8S3Q304_MYTED|nr:RIC1 [Mytilus edulis]